MIVTPRPSSSSREAAPAHGPHPRELWRLRDQALRELRRADPQTSLAAAEAWLAEASPGTEEFAWATRALAHSFRLVGASARALEQYAWAEEFFEQHDLAVEAARTAAGHMDALRYLGRYDEAVRLALRTQRFFRARAEVLDGAKLTNNLGIVYRRLGRLESARLAYLAAARDFRRCGDLAEEAKATLNLGNILADLGRYDEAERAQCRAIRLYSRLEQWAAVALAKLNLGLLLKRRGDYAPALIALRESRELYQKLELSRGQALVELNLAETNLALNLLGEAEEAAERARQGFEQLDLPFELGQALLWSAAVSARLDEPQHAAEALTSAAALFEQSGNRVWEAIATLHAAALGDPSESSLDRLRQARRILLAAGAHDRATEASLIEAELLERLGRKTGALSRFRAVAKAIRHSQDSHLTYRVHAALGQATEARSATRALGHYRLAIDHLEALRNQARADDIRRAFLSDKSDVYERTVRLLLEAKPVRGRLVEALTTVERSKSPGLLEDLLSVADRGDRQAATQARQLRDLRARLSDAYARQDEMQSEEDPARAMAVTDLEQQVTNATRHLQLTLRGETVVEAFDLGRLQVGLPAKTLLLEYYGLGRELVCFVVERERLRLRRAICDLDAVERVADRLRFHLGKGVFGARYLEARLPGLRHGLDHVLEELWRLLLAPLRGELRSAEHIVVVPHGPLHGLPLHAACDQGVYLCERWRVSYAPSARIFAACASRPETPPSRPLFVAPPNERLPGARREVAALARLFPASEKLAGHRATLASLRRRAGHFDLLHLAAEGKFRADNPSFSMLQLADGWLSVADLAEISRGVTLVTLSACESGLNGVQAGEELIGLTRAVLGGGASSLLASLWSIHDEATSQFMEAFYHGLHQGDGKLASLQQAMFAVRRDRDHPYFWAPFALAGAA